MGKASVDVSAEIEINAAPADVAAVLFDPAREPEWMPTVKTVEVLDRALQPGARVKRTAAIMGRSLNWTTAVESVHFPHGLTMRVIEGPFTGLITYAVQRTATGSNVRIRNSGEADVPMLVPVGLLESGLRGMIESDLGRLKTLVEGA